MFERLLFNELKKINAMLDELETIVNIDNDLDLFEDNCKEAFLFEGLLGNNDCKTQPKQTPTPLKRWEVCECEPKEDKNKVFGINIRVDEPRREDYTSRVAFERDHEKFDNLVDAAAECTWENKDNEAPLHKVDAIRRRIEDGPPMNLNLVGETHWW
jgi:hypothetical protein